MLEFSDQSCFSIRKFLSNVMAMKKSFTVLTKAKRRIFSVQMDKNWPRGVPRSLVTISPFFHRHASSSSPTCFASPFLDQRYSLSTPIFLSLSSLISHNILSQSHMEKLPQDTGEAVKGQIRESCGKEASDFKSSKSLSDYIIPHILNLYASRATPQDFEIYAPHATFEDPLMRAHGVNQIKSAFYSLAKVFSESRIVDYSIQENVISPGKMEILIDNKQYYKFLGKDIDMISLIKLYTEDGKIVRHEDWWDKKPLWDRETVKAPLVGRIIEATRRASMLATHALMRFGKDLSN